MPTQAPNLTAGVTNKTVAGTVPCEKKESRTLRQIPLDRVAQKADKTRRDFALPASGLGSSRSPLDDVRMAAEEKIRSLELQAKRLDEVKERAERRICSLQLQAGSFEKVGELANATIAKVQGTPSLKVF